MANNEPIWHAPPPQGMLRVAPILCVPDLLREFGVDPGPLLEQAGIAADLLGNPDNVIAMAKVGSLTKACVRATGCEHFGLLVGRRGDASVLGAVGFLMRNAPDVRTAIDELVANADLHDRGATPFLQVGETTTVLGYELYRHDIDGAEQIIDGTMAVVWNLMRNLCGPDWLPVEVRFRRHAPANPEPYRQFFQAPLCFDADQTAMVFRTSFLARKVYLADPLLRQHFVQHLLQIRRYSSQTFPEKIHQALLLLLGSERCTLEKLSGHFSLHPRTLNRRLQEAGTSFRELYNRARHDMACQLLRDSNSSIDAIAALLGYSGTTAFNRAFSQWEGTPPSTWRRRQRGP
jgi:AraC-like DNA-binding protein